MNAPTIAPEIQHEAARSLLERLAEKTALVRFFRYNASAKHGVPIDTPSSSGLWTDRQTSETTATTTTTPQPQPQPQPQPVQQPQPAATITPQNVPANISVNLTQPQPTQSTGQTAPQNSNDFLKGILISLATVAGIGGAGFVGYNMANKEPAPVVQNTEKIEQQKWPQSPLQFLEDRGEHLP